MQELRLVGLAEDGENLVLTDGETGRFTLALNDELRTVIRRDRRVAAEANAGPSAEATPLRPRDVQGLIRAGVALDEIAERAGWSVDKVRRYEGPIRAERDYISGLAQAVELYGPNETVTLRERADKRLSDRGVEAERVVWDSWKSSEESWTVVVRFPAGGRLREATWLFDPQDRSLRSVDDEARWLGGDEIADVSAMSAPTRPTTGKARPERDANVYDVEAEGGVADPAGPAIGSKRSTSARSSSGRNTSPSAGLTDSVRARAASRGRGKGTTVRSSATPGTSTTSATALPGQSETGVESRGSGRGNASSHSVERLDLDVAPPPTGSRGARVSDEHDNRETAQKMSGSDRPSEYSENLTKHDVAGEDTSPASSSPKTTAGRTSSQGGALARNLRNDAPGHRPLAGENETTDDAANLETPEAQQGERPEPSARETAADNEDSGVRRKPRRGRVLRDTTIRHAWRGEVNDEDEDAGLFGDLPGFHDGGGLDSADSHSHEDMDGHEGFGDDADHTVDDAEFESENFEDEGFEEADRFDEELRDDHSDAAQPAPARDDAESDEQAPKKGSGSRARSEEVPSRPSSTKRAGRPSVPSWDDIMFGGRGNKR